MITNLAIVLSASEVPTGRSELDYRPPPFNMRLFPVLTVVMVCVTVLCAVVTVVGGAAAVLQARAHSDRAAHTARGAAGSLVATAFSAAFCALMIWVS